MDSFETEMLTTVTTTAMMCRCETMMQQMQTNFFGVLNVTNAVLPYLRERMRGTIVVRGLARLAHHADFSAAEAVHEAVSHPLLRRRRRRRHVGASAFARRERQAEARPRGREVLDRQRPAGNGTAVLAPEHAAHAAPVHFM